MDDTIYGFIKSDTKELCRGFHYFKEFTNTMFLILADYYIIIPDIDIMVRVFANGKD